MICWRGFQNYECRAPTSSFLLQRQTATVSEIGKVLSVATFWKAVCRKPGTLFASPPSSFPVTWAITSV